MTKRFAVTVTLTKTAYLDLDYTNAEEAKENFDTGEIVYDMHRGDHDEEVDCQLISDDDDELSTPEDVSHYNMLMLYLD